MHVSLLTYAKELLIVTFCDMTAGIGANFWTHTQGRTDGQTIMEVEIFIQISTFLKNPIILTSGNMEHIEQTRLPQNT